MLLELTSQTLFSLEEWLLYSGIATRNYLAGAGDQ